MSLFKNRFLALGFGFFLITLYLSYFASMNIIFIICALSLTLTIIFWTMYRKRKSIKFLDICLRVSICAFFVILACIIGALTFHQDKKQGALCDGLPHVIEGEVDSVISDNGFYAHHIVTVDKIDGREQKIKISLIDNESKLEKNSRFQASVIFSQLESREIGFDSAEYYLSQGILLCGEIEEYFEISVGEKDIYDLFLKINSFLDSILKKRLSEKSYPIASALILGNKENLPLDVKQDFTVLGIVHVLCLSGMHVSIIVTMLSFAILRLPTSKISQFLLLAGSVVAFVGICGFSSPAIRAGTMQILCFLLVFLWTKQDTVTSLFASVTIMCAISPYLLFSLSLLLSFFAMIGCVCASRILFKSKRLYRVKSKFLRLFIRSSVTTLGVTFISLPLTYAYFGTVSLASVFANFLIVPILNIAIYLLPFLLLLSPVPFISDVLAFACGTVCSFVIDVCDYFGDFEFVFVHITGSIQEIGVYVIFIGSALAIILSKKQLRYCICAIFVGVTVLTFGVLTTANLRREYVSFTSYSYVHNDVICVEKENSLSVIDISSHSLNSVFPSDMSKYLGYARIENYVVLTYSHKSLNYFDRITDTVSINNIFLTAPKTEKEQEYFDECVYILKKKELQYTVFDRFVSFDGVTLDTCAHDTIERSDIRCVIFNLKIRDFDYTYMGASAYEIASTLPNEYASKGDVLVFGSYGPKYQKMFKYSAPSCDYISFLGDSINFADGEFLDKFKYNYTTKSPCKIKIDN